MTIQRVKDALRIQHGRLDDEISANIAVARAEMIRAGISEKASGGDDPLIEEAIVVYCLYKMAPAENERYWESWSYQMDNLRKSRQYRAVNG